MKQVKTLRFGTIEAGDEHLIRMRDGIIGMGKLKDFILVESPAYPLMLWLQSCDDERIAFPVIEPTFFKADYNPRLNQADKICLNLEDQDRLKLFTILTIPEVAENMTVNLRAPIAINLTKGTGAQIVLQDKDLQVRQPAWAAFSNARDQLESFEGGDESSWAPICIQENERPELLAAV